MKSRCGGNILRKWHKFVDTGTSDMQRWVRNRGDKVRNKRYVTITGAEEILTSQVLKTDLSIITCFETLLVYWYIGVNTETVFKRGIVKTAS